MFLSYFTLFVALSLSAVAAWYSIIGLTAIFAAAVMPIIIMGGILEVAKITTTVWLHAHWHRCRWPMKLYLVPAVGMLMLITSMGIFGFLSKAHIDQVLPTGDAAAQIQILDERIAIQQEYIVQARKDMTILNDQIDRYNELGAVTRGVRVRAQQKQEREVLLSQVDTAQQAITQLREQRAPLATSVRAIEAEVGPIKYIAALIYSGNPDTDLLEKAVRWVIILLVVVFDPLAIMLVLAANQSITWRREQSAMPAAPAYEPDDGPLTSEQINQIEESVAQFKESDVHIDTHLPGWMYQAHTPKTHPYLEAGFGEGFKDLKPMVAMPEPGPTELPTVPVEYDDDDDFEPDETPGVKAAIKKWKSLNPSDTIKHQRYKFHRKEIDELPWSALVEELPDIQAQHGFGTQLPNTGRKRDTFVRIDQVPNRVYKHNGLAWIEVDKHLNDSYTYNSAYIDHLIDKIAQKQYDPDLLSESEREQVASRLTQKSNT
jgi:hypothetical protein